MSKLDGKDFLIIIAILIVVFYIFGFTGIFVLAFLFLAALGVAELRKSNKKNK
jgi:Na+/H+ antiporter NhaC